MQVVRATYHAQVDARLAEARAETLCLEQTVEMPRSTVSDPFVESEILGRVAEIAPDPEGGFRLAIDYPVATTAFQPAQLMNVLFGNSSLQEDVRLMDVELPPELRERLGGPRLGIAGLRRLTDVHDRPLTCTAVKPMGLAPEALAELCETFALGGIDVIKDDHGLADHSFCPFEERARACLAAIERAADATGRRALYVPNLTGTPDAVRWQLDTARRLGARAVLVAPMLIGLPLLWQIRCDHPDLAILAHPAFAGALRIAPPVLLGKLYRVFGADASIYTNWGGRFGYDAELCARISEALRGEWKPLHPALPVAAGGMSVERVPELVDFYGRDVMLLIGGNLYEAGEKLLERSRDFVASVRAAAERLKR